jgi:hypothetical protein
MAMLVAGEGKKKKINSKQPHIPNQQQHHKIPTIFIFRAQFSPLQRTVTLLLYSKLVLYITTKPSTPYHHFFPAKFNDPQMYI